MKANPPPLQKGGSVFGISSGHVSSFTVKKSGAFSPPFLKGGGGDFLFITPLNAQQKTAPALPQGRLTFRMKANPPQPPFKKGGAYFRFLVGMFHRLLLKNQVLFLPPF
jgi:hypothetical protein